MLEFNVHPYTHIFFGKDQMDAFFDELANLGYKKILLAYGHGSIKKSGLYDAVVQRLKKHNISFIDLEGIDPNPRLSTVEKGVKLCKENNLEFILAVGGGSTIDCSKAIALGYYMGVDKLWETMRVRGNTDAKALPIGDILTLSATGSESNAGFVITNEKTKEKLGYMPPRQHTRPQIALLDPTLTYSVNAYQTAAGSSDILSHIIEQYFSSTENTFVADRLLEGLAKTIIHYAPIAIAEPSNYEARANLMWASTLALNYVVSAGRTFEGTVHFIEHALSAYYDVTHGVGLAILTPRYLEAVLDEKTVGRYASFFYNVFDIHETNKMDVAKKGIKQLTHFFESLKIPMHLSEIDVKKEDLEKITQSCFDIRQANTIGIFKPLNKTEILNIFNASY